MNTHEYRFIDNKITLLEARIYALKNLKERNREVTGALLSDVEDDNEKISYGRINKPRRSFATSNLRTYIKGDKVVLENYSTIIAFRFLKDSTVYMTSRDYSQTTSKIKREVRGEIYGNHEYDLVTLPEEYFRDSLYKSQSEVETFLNRVGVDNLISMKNISNILGISSNELQSLISAMEKNELDPLGIDKSEIQGFEQEILSNRKTAKRKDEWKQRFVGNYQAEENEISL
jgi:hypothetical protein